ncbi:hypothetical protein [Herbaspirillum rubrisubalbicans]|nr:hypothetical protein [Herbaspirillum rubrisubalbicans]
MRVSKKFKLGKTQAELDFIDIDIDKDIPLYIDPHLIGISDHPFSHDCHATISSFFNFFLELVRRGEVDRARALFSHLHEPNETCLGSSKGRPNGRGVANKQAGDIFNSIMESRAIETGVLEHLEDFRIFVPGIGPDKVSDMTTNIIRLNLIEYTQEQCRLHDIPLQSNIASGPYWNEVTRQWERSHHDMLVISNRPILLVPKCLVSYGLVYSFDRYYNRYLLNFVKHDHLVNNGPFVRNKTFANGRTKVWVTKGDMRKHVAPPDKDFVAGYTEQHKDLFVNFRKDAKKYAKPLESQEIDGRLLVSDIALHLIDVLRKTPSGNDHASAYHKLIVGILELLFYPSLTRPRKEQEIYDGRKRIDIVFDNAASSGELYRLQTKRISAAYVMVECKNYSKDVANPELDQLAGRFSFRLSQFGFLVCRSVSDYPTLIARCHDLFAAKQELILPVLDEDVINMLQKKADNPLNRPEEEFLADRIREVMFAAPEKRLAKKGPGKSK